MTACACGATEQLAFAADRTGLARWMCRACRTQEASLASRDGRQRRLAEWARAAFGTAEVDNLPQRALRLLEETIEAYQACGGDAELAHKLVDFVFARPVGELHQEIGGVSVCMLVLAEVAGLSADEEELREMRRVLAKPIEHFTERNAAKNAAGLKVS